MCPSDIYSYARMAPPRHQVNFTCCAYTQGNVTVSNDTCRRYFEPCALMFHALIMMEVYSLVRHAHLWSDTGPVRICLRLTWTL